MHARASLQSTLAPALLLSFACSGPVGDDEASRTRDSAGIRIVESGRPRWSADGGWRVGTPSITIGAADGEAGQTIDHVVGATRLDDGTIIVADAGSRSLLRYDAGGRYIGSAGRVGEGPGEFRALGWLGRIAGDTLLAWDRGLNRVSVFAPTGTYVREYRPELTELPMSLEVKGQLSGGRLLLARGADFISAAGSQGVQRQPITAWLLSATGEESRAFGPFPGEAVELKAGRTPNSTIRTPVPFGPATLFAAAGDEVYVVDTERFEVRVYESTGTLSRIFRKSHTRLPVRAEDLAAYFEERLERVPPIPTIRAGLRASFDQVPKPELQPAVRALHVDREGHVWLEGARHSSESVATWSVFDPEGHWLGDVRIPATLRVLEIGTDYILVMGRDELDVQRVRVLPLTRTPS